MQIFSATQSPNKVKLLPQSVLVTIWILLCQSPTSTQSFWRNMRHRQLRPNPSSSASMPVSSRSASMNSPSFLFGGSLSLGGLLSGGSSALNDNGGDPLWYRQRPAAVQRPPSFSCQGLKDGVYADVEADCKVYHRCAHGFRQTYYCDEETRFDASTESCEPADAVECSASLPGENVPVDAQPRRPNTEVLATKSTPSTTTSTEMLLSEVSVSSNILNLNNKNAIRQPSASVSNNLCLTCVKPQCFQGVVDVTDEPSSDSVVRFPVIGSQCRAYFQCRRGVVDGEVFLCPDGQYFDVDRSRCSSVSITSTPLPSCSTAENGSILTLANSKGDTMFAVCENGAVITYGVCPKDSPIYDKDQKTCKNNTKAEGFVIEEEPEQKRHNNAMISNQYSIPSDSRQNFDPNPMHIVVAHVDSRHPGTADVEEQLMMMENEDESALTLLTPDDVMNNDHRYSYISSGSAGKSGDEDDDDDTKNGDDDEIRCMELPDGVYVMSSDSTEHSSTCVDCRRGVRAMEFPCHDSTPSNRRWAPNAHKSAPKNFCAGRDPGVYADVTQNCESFVVCRLFRAPVRGYCPGEGEKFDDAAGRGCVKRGSCANFQVLSSSSSHISSVIVPPSTVVHGRHGTSAIDMTAAEASHNNQAHGSENAVNTPEALLAEEQQTRGDNLCADGRVGFFPDIKSDCTKYYMCMPGGVHVEQECAPGLIFDTASQLCKDEKFAVCIEPIPLPMPELNCTEVGPGYHFQYGSDCKVWTLCPPGDEEPATGGGAVQPKLGTGRGGAAGMAMSLSSVVPPYLLRPFSSPASPGSTSTFRQLSATLARFQGLRASRLLRMNGPQQFDARAMRREGQSWQCPPGTRIDRIRLICRSEEKVSCPVAATRAIRTDIHF